MYEPDLDPKGLYGNLGLFIVCAVLVPVSFWIFPPFAILLAPIGLVGLFYTGIVLIGTVVRRFLDGLEQERHRDSGDSDD